jgi:hypothetical protein
MKHYFTFIKNIQTTGINSSRYFILLLFLILPFSGRGQTLDYLIEDFKVTKATLEGKGWEFSTSFTVDTTNKVLSNTFSLNVMRFWTTPYVVADNDPKFSFFYRVMQTNGLSISSVNFKIVVCVSTDGVNYSRIDSIGAGNHTISSDFAYKSFDLSSFKNQTIKVRVEVSRTATPSIIVDFANVSLGSFYPAAFTVSNSLDSFISGANISVANLGSQITDNNGKATIKLPNGIHSYSISATDYISYTGQSLVVQDDSIQPAITLLGEFNVSLNVLDQGGAGVPTFRVIYTGQIPVYGGGTVVYEEGVLTNFSGQASLKLPEGVYGFEATKSEYYSQQGTFVMGPSARKDTLNVQIFPRITLKVNYLEEGNPISIEGAAVKITGKNVVYTNSEGEVSMRLPMGNYNVDVSKPGFYTLSFPLVVENNNDIVEDLILSVAPAKLDFKTDNSEGLNFKYVPVGNLSDALSVIITNSGSGNVIVAAENIFIKGNDADEFKLGIIPDIINMATSEEFKLTITFEPSTTGMKTAQLVIEEVSGEEIIPHTIELTGHAYEPKSLPFFDDFSSGNFNNWIVVNGLQVNQWHVGEPAGVSGEKAAIISDNGGASNQYQSDAIDEDSPASTVHFYMDFVIPNNTDSLYLMFNWKGRGESNADMLMLYDVDPTIYPEAGVRLGSEIRRFFGETNWREYVYSIPLNHRGETRRFIFSWTNDGNSGLQPPAAIDNIFIGGIYELTTEISPEGKGTATGEGFYKASTEIELTAVAGEHYTFSYWSATEGEFSNLQSAITLFTMPSFHTVVTAHFLPVAPSIEDMEVVYNGNVYTLTPAVVQPGFSVKWYDALQDGNEIPAPSAKDAGTYTGWIAHIDEGGFEGERIQATLTILPRQIQILAEDKSKIYGGADPELTWQITSGTLVEGDDFIGGLTREAGEITGQYEIQIGTLSAGENYEIDFSGSLLLIQPRIITIEGTFTVSDKYFDGNNSAVIATNNLILSGVINDDDVLLDNLVVVFAQSAPGEDIEVIIESFDLTGDDRDNYVADSSILPATQATILALPQYLVSVEVTPVDGGTINGFGSFTAGTKVDLIAIAAQDHAFLRWESAGGEVLGTDAEYSFDMPAEDVTIKAVFQSFVAADNISVTDLKLFPNPATTILHVSSNNKINEVTITDLIGKTIYSKIVEDEQVTIDVSHMIPGIYLMRINTNMGVQVRKFYKN